jgi:hypothetical protein
MVAGIQYVFPYGTTGSTFTTPATITSGAFAAGTVTATLDVCPPDLWGGPGDALFTTTDAGGLLRHHGNLVQMVLDTAGSGVQELVSLTAIIPTGVTGLHGFQTCQTTFTAAFAHGANAPIVTTQFTADQTWTDWKLEIPYDVAALYPNIKIIDTLSAMGRQVINPGLWTANELHPTLTGYGLRASRILLAAAPFQVAPQTPPTPNPETFMQDVVWITQSKPALDIAFDPDVAVRARGLALGNNCGAYYSKCNLDPNFFYPSQIGNQNTASGTAGVYGSSMPAATGQILTADGQTGDFICMAVGGCWQPTTIPTPTVLAANNVRITYTGTPTNTLQGRLDIMRAYYVDPVQGSFFAAHQMTYPLSGTYNLTISSSTTTTIVFTVQKGQNPAIIGGTNLSCQQIEMQTGDWILWAGNLPGLSGTAGGKTQLAATGSWNPTTCTWTDASASFPAITAGVMANLVQQYRAGDASFNTVTAASLNVAVLTPSVGVSIAATPAYPTGGFLLGSTAAITGGNCANGTAYSFKTAYMPLYWGTNYAHAGAIGTTVGNWTPVTGTTTDTIRISFSGAGSIAPYGYTIVLYLQIAGIYYAVGSAPTASVVTTCPATGAGLSPANAADNSSLGYTGGTFNSTASQTTVNCGTSGTAIFAQTQAGTSEKKVLVHLAACNGAASYTFPTAYTNTPGIFPSSTAAAALVTALSNTAVTVTGSTSTGTIVLDDF